MGYRSAWFSPIDDWRLWQEPTGVRAKFFTIARKIETTPQLSSILLSLGKTAAGLKDPKAALDYFEQAEQVATNTGDRLQARLGHFKLFLDYDKPELATPLAPQLLKTT